MQAGDKHQIDEMKDSRDEVALVMESSNDHALLIKLVYDWSHNSGPDYNSSKGSSTICYLTLLKFTRLP
jgi:hypothetical protein